MARMSGGGCEVELYWIPERLFLYNVIVSHRARFALVERERGWLRLKRSMRMNESHREAVEEQTQVGSYFVANYPPFSVWTKDDVERAAAPALQAVPAP